MKRLVYSLFFAVLLLTLGTETSYSIPAFARKYKTSCATCHNGYPKLNAFGEAFRRSGYQFPGGTDPEFIKEEPVSLGAEGNKKAFPDAIWPGSLPGSSPLSLFLNGEVDYNPKVDPRFTFDGLGSSIEGVASGTLGEDPGRLPGQIASGNAFLFPSAPRLTGSSFVNSGSVPPGNWYPLRRNASPNAFNFG